MASQEFLAILDEIRDIHSRKSQDYGNSADPLANIRSSAEFGVEPWRSALVRLNDKVHRLKQFCVTGSLACEGVEDSLLDLASYAVITLVMFREGNHANQDHSSGS